LRTFASGQSTVTPMPSRSVRAILLIRPLSTYLDYTGILMTIRALAGENVGHNADTAFDTGSWRESTYLQKLQECSGNLHLTMNWCVFWVH
jgi:hypothetical protein